MSAWSTAARGGADANARNDYGSTPLSEAAVVGNVEVIKKLLKAGADVESPNADGQTALMIIARTSNVEAAKRAARATAPTSTRVEQWRGQTPLMWAAAESQPAMVKLLVEHGAQVNARSTRQQLGAAGHLRAAHAGAPVRRLHAFAVRRAQGLPGVREDPGRRPAPT